MRNPLDFAEALMVGGFAILALGASVFIVLGIACAIMWWQDRKGRK